jgi:hypothetical protein
MAKICKMNKGCKDARDMCKHEKMIVSVMAFIASAGIFYIVFA